MSSPDEQHHRLETMAEGREAVAMMGALRPYIDNRIMNLVHLQIAHYRKNTAEHSRLLGIAAEMSCLMGLLSDLDSRARRGDVAAMQELRDAKA